MEKKASAEKAVREIRRKTRRRFSAEEKIRIVIEGLRDEESIASLCRRPGWTTMHCWRSSGGPCRSSTRPPSPTVTRGAAVGWPRLAVRAPCRVRYDPSEASPGDDSLAPASPEERPT